jgi:hypothetical protein
MGGAYPPTAATSTFAVVAVVALAGWAAVTARVG